MDLSAARRHAAMAEEALESSATTLSGTVAVEVRELANTHIALGNLHVAIEMAKVTGKTMEAAAAEFER